MTLQLIVFIVLALFIAVCSVLAVTTSRILRAATYLLFVLFGTAGIYFQLNYSFLGAVQLLIYAGGITVLYVFSILLTSSQGDKAERLKNGKMVAGAISTIAGLAICLFVMLKNEFLPSHFVHGELDVRTIGHALTGVGPSIASGNQMCNGNIALLPAPPINISPKANGIILPATAST